MKIEGVVTKDEMKHNDGKAPYYVPNGQGGVFSKPDNAPFNVREITLAPSDPNILPFTIILVDAEPAIPLTGQTISFDFAPKAKKTA